VTLYVGDRFEFPLTREARDSGQVPLEAGFRYLVAETGEPVVVTLRAATGNSVRGVWDGATGMLTAPGLDALLPRAGDSALADAERDDTAACAAGRLSLDVEAIDAPVFRVGLIGSSSRGDLTFPETASPGGSGRGQERSPERAPEPAAQRDPAARKIGGVPVRFESVAGIIDRLARGAHAPLQAWRLNRWAHTIALTPGFEELVSLPFLRDVVPYEHQITAVKTVLNRMRGRALLADEVGLGKTVEAGIVLSELLRRRLARRVLVLVPPGLVTQWQEELRRKFNLDFVSHDADVFRQEGPGAWTRFERVVSSFHTAKRAEHARVIAEIAYDLVIVDEAHHLRNARTVLWQFVNRLRRTYLLLLTATPVQNDLEELFNLVTLLQPGQLKTLRAFRREHLVRGDRRQPRDPEGLRRLLGDVMVRNRRATAPVALTRRIARTVVVEPTPVERNLYTGLSAFLREQGRPGGGVTRMLAQTLQMELGSSVPAALASLDRVLAGPREAPGVAARLLQFRESAAAVEHDAKSAALLGLLASWPDKLLVFTRYRATQEHLARVLVAAGEDVALYHGALRRQEKENVVQAFAGRCRVMVSTEAGGEGRNLQFAHGLVNYDLPWNPMRIEQRIGRLSRVGQTRDVHVFNLVAPGTIEEAILEVLDAKINMFELVIGEIDMILGQLSTDQDFEELVTDLWLGAEDADAFRAGMHALGDQLLDAKRAYLSIKALDDRLFGDALAPVGA
jgi:superfamily II DNA or RNA helicase